MFKRKDIIIIFILIVSIEVIILCIYNSKVEKGKIINEEENKNNLQYKNDSEEAEASIPNSKVFKTDMEYILQYKGGELEPEWEWVKNISIVYTWVDGNDIDFLDIKSKYNGGFREYNSRDRSADELRYSIRSLTEYLPWHNGTLYILTNSQIPKWLDTSNPRVKLVFHKDVFPEHITPTYDSSTIELYLDKIPGITERFIYFNDDFFVNNYIHPAYFFTSKTFYPKIYRKDEAKLKRSYIDKVIQLNDIHKMFQASKFFTNEIIKEYFDKKFVYLNGCHSGYVFYRDLFEPFRQLFKEELKMVCADRFRSPYKLHFLYLYHTYLQYATREDDFPNKLGGNGKAKEFKGYTLPANRTIKKYSVEIVPPEIAKKKIIEYAQISDDSRSNKNFFKFFRNNKNILVYNFNDSYEKEKALYEFMEYMITRYPKPSEFEKKEYIELEEAILPKINESNILISTEIVKSTESIFNKVYYALHFRDTAEKYKMNILKEYVNKMEELAGPKKQFSDREVEEVDLLLKYKSDFSLLSTWKWDYNFSFVYIFENANANNNPSINELKYSLRSLEYNLPWFSGDIFIVTQKKVNDEFAWLNLSNSNIHVINQDQIIPKEAAQTQNVHIIEMYLDKIPGISERFVYLKNNHYFINYTHPQFFFSKEFYPKYNLKDALTDSEIKIERKNNKAFFNTYDAIVDFFGKTYVTKYRHFKDAPFPFYRDLFEPSRKLYENYVNETLTHTHPTTTDLLPLYMVTTYNIYGTDQPYYPKYVTGYGKIRDAEIPKLNKKRTIDYYGFDITSPYISNRTMILDISFNNDSDNNRILINKIKNSKKLFFSFKIEDQKSLTATNISYLQDFMDSLYKEKSSFEL